MTQLELKALYDHYSPKGGRAYDPKMLLGLLFYAYSTGIFSSRRLERATYEQIPFRYLAGNLHPDHATLANFRRTFLSQIEDLFVQVLLLAHTAGVLKLGHLSLDGTKIHADASKSRAVSYKRLLELQVQKYHIALLKQVKPLVPEGREVIFLGDSEFDGCRLLRRLDHYGWHYVCRNAKSSLGWLGDEQTNFGKLAVEPNSVVSLADTTFSKYEYGPVQAIAVWQAEYKEPLYLVTNLALAEEAIWYYRLRFRIETFFSDSKSRGFRLDKSRLKEPKRLGCLLLAACLAYLWMVYLGTVARVEGWNKVIHRTERVDYSLFNPGLNLLEHFFNEMMPLPASLIPLDHEVFKCVR